jgi:poly(hydroxyalkanoate) granule-associated protein
LRQPREAVVGPLSGRAAGPRPPRLAPRRRRRTASICPRSHPPAWRPAGIAQSQAEFLVTQLEKTGNIGQREAERLLSELRSTREKAQGRAEQEAGRIDRFIEGKIEDVLNRINIPSRSDIERLNHSVDVLTAKVEALVSRQERGGSR